MASGAGTLRSIAAGLRLGRWRALVHGAWQLLVTTKRRHGWRGLFARLRRHAFRWPGILRALAHTARADAPAIDRGADARHALPPPRLHPELGGPAEIIDAAVSVVIPVLNGGIELELLIRRLLDQRGVRSIEVVVVDSGSTDGSVQRAREAGARVIELAPQDFSHSHARNLGADHAGGDHLLFMVQDAYPIGELWVHGLLRYLLDHREQGVVAASCAEYCRSDSDAMYDCMIDTHYRYLGCRDRDRVGAHVGDDHTSLRTMGQLSDVACILPRELFQRFRYRGKYAEDMDLGIRLIQAGHRIAMLASVKVIHSHRRPAWYFLKRAFVDVVFLVDLFDDFDVPPCTSIDGLVTGMRVVAEHAGRWCADLAALPDGAAIGEVLGGWIAAAHRWALVPAGGELASLGDPRVQDFVEQLWRAAPPMRGAAPSAQHTAQARRFVEEFIGRIDHFNRFASPLYDGADHRLRAEFAAAVRIAFASAVGATLAHWHLERRAAATDDPERRWSQQVFDQLTAGV
ncbi:glycosyltransferase family 2 protein [Aquabacterium humicola]|uniref:glycosyltransferase family 2 protein n=1 Tax=Aquabacterium humicola TaxID=3237377 RepID=UPI002542DE3D|nr:glycosyltransferase [Rubrivivax pictus]